MGTTELALVGLFGSVIGTALAAPMVWPAKQSDGQADARLIGGWLLACSVIAALISGRVIGLVPASAAVEHTVNLVGLSAFPVLYLYVREATRRPLRVPLAWRLWLPAFAYAAVLAVRAGIGVGTRVPFGWILPVVLGFTGLCAHAALTRRADHRPTLIPPWWIVGSLVLINLAQIVRMQFGHVTFVPALVPVAITGMFVGTVGLSARRALAPGPVPDAPAAPRYARSGLVPDAAAKLYARVETALTAERLFADPELTLGKLAAAVDATPHQVSEALNRQGVTFHMLVSRSRVADVKAQLRDPGADRYSIEGIGASAGFGSRSALYAAFRRVEGITPAEFRQQARDSATR